MLFEIINLLLSTETRFIYSKYISLSPLLRIILIVNYMDAAIDHPLEGVYVSLFAWRQVRWGTVLIRVLFNSRPNSLVTAPLIGI